MPDGRNEVYEFGRFRLDVGEHRITCLDGVARPPLAEKAFRTLVQLVRHGGTLLTHEELLAAVWPGLVVEPNNLSKAIHAVRVFLGDTGRAAQYVETVPKHGYRFIAPVRRTDPEPAAPPGVSSKCAQRVRSPAYDLYIRGKVRAGAENAADTDEAIRLFEAAVAIDPLFAEALAHLARTCNTRAFKFSTAAEAADYHERAEIALEKALDLDPTVAEAHFARGLILWTRRKGFPHEHAIRAFRRSLELAPEADETHHQLSMVLAHVGLLDEAQHHVRVAVGLNPNNTMARFRAGVYAAWQCRFDDALAVFRTVPKDVSPMLVDRSRAEALVQLGRNAEAGAIVDEYLHSRPADEGGSFTSVRALLLAQQGRQNEANEAIACAIAIGQGFGHFHHTAYNIGSACAALGRADEAVDWLEAAADDGFPCQPYFGGDPNLAGLRGNARYRWLLDELRRRGDAFREALGEAA